MKLYEPRSGSSRKYQTNSIGRISNVDTSTRKPIRKLAFAGNFALNSCMCVQIYKPFNIDHKWLSEAASRKFKTKFPPITEYEADCEDSPDCSI